MKKPNRSPDSKSTKREPECETRLLSELVPHPDQGKFFKDLDGPNLQELAADIAKNGLDHPIDVLPKNKAGFPVNTITGGHQRRRAQMLLKRKETLVRVRYDLADATRDEIDAEFLRDNLHRRQMGPLAKARTALALYEKERGRKVSTTDWGDLDTARDYVGKLNGMSGRNLQRYFCILYTPHSVQEAFERGDLKLVDAARVAQLDDAVQNKIAAEIRDGKIPRDVVRRQLRDLPKKCPRPVRTFRSQLEKLLASLDAIVPVVHEIEVFGEKSIKTVRTARLQLQRVHQEMEQKRANGDAQAELCNAVDEIRKKVAGQ